LGTLSLAPGHYYYFSGRVRTDGFEPGSEAYISLVFFGPDEYYKRFVSAVVTTNTVGSGEENEWVEVSRVITVPSQADTARVECHLDGKGQVWFDHLFLGLDIALGLSKAAYPDPVAPGGFLTYTITYSNTGMEPAQNVEIRDFRDTDTHFVAATPMPVPPSDDEWPLGILATTTGSIVDIVTVDPHTQKNCLFNLARMTSVNQVSNFQPVELTLLVSATIGVVGHDGCAVCIQPPPNEESTLSPGTISLSHQVHNCGAITTNVTVTVSPPPAWTAVPPVTLISNLPPSQTEQVVVQLNIPSGVPAGTEGAALWSAAAACGGASAGITDVIGVISRPGPVFLPIAAKRYYPPCPDLVGDPCDPGQDRYEPNNVHCSTTTPLVSGVSIQAPLCSPADKSDYYYLDVMVAGNLKIWLANVPSGTDYDLYLYYETAPTQHVRRSANWGTADEYIEYNVPADKLGRYYVRVHAFSGSSSSSYTLRATYPVPTGNQHLVLNEYSADVSTHLSHNRHP
jgi:uncharacterized repeat protein (TIGR01451 family)